MKLFMAPLQGYTDAPYRLFHTEVFGGADGCFSPFLRWEKGEPARRTMRDILSPLNAETAGFVPQIIFRDAEEMRRLAGALKAEGFDRVTSIWDAPSRRRSPKAVVPGSCSEGRRWRRWRPM